MAALSEQFVEDSSSDSESELSDQGQTSQAATTTSNRITEPMKNGQNGTRGSSNSTSDSDSEAASQSDSTSATSSSKSTAGVKRKGQAQESFSPAQKKPKSSKSQPGHIPSAPYQPPTGYEQVKTSEADHMSMFDKETLSSKQIWHITVPASVPISTIKSLDMQAALRGEPTLEHNGTKYNIHAVPARGETLLLPSGSDGKYARIDMPVSRNLHFREITQVKPSAKATSEKTQAPPEQINGTVLEVATKFTAQEIGRKRLPRPAVRGLMMRYHPYGSAVDGKEKMSNPEKDDDDEQGEIDQSSNFKAPPELPMDVDTETITETPKRDKKIRKKDKQQAPRSSQVTRPNEDAMDIDSPVPKAVNDVSSEKKKKRIRKKQKPDTTVA